MNEQRPIGSSNWTLVIAALLLLPLLFWSLGVIGDDQPDTEGTATPRPTAAPAKPAATPETAIDRSDPDAEVPRGGPVEAAASLARADAGGVPTLGAIIDDGVLYVFGAVPASDDAAGITALASGLVGADRVVDLMVIDTRADLPASLTVRIDDAARWSPDASELDDRLTPLASALGVILAADPAAGVTVVGHLAADEDTDDLLVLDRSRRRAETFAQAVLNAGAQRSQVTVIGRGASHPTSDNGADPSSDNRIEVVISL